MWVTDKLNFDNSKFDIQNIKKMSEGPQIRKLNKLKKMF